MTHEESKTLRATVIRMLRNGATFNFDPLSLLDFIEDGFDRETFYWNGYSNMTLEELLSGAYDPA